MSRPLSVASVIEKNKVVSDNPFLVMLDIEVVDPNTDLLVETLHIVQNDENVIFNGTVYTAANFKIDITQNKDEEAQVQLVIQDQTQMITERMEAYAGGVGFEVMLIIANAARLDQPPEMKEHFKVVGATIANYVATFTLGAENLLGMRFPPTNQFRDRCRWRFKTTKCGYTGPHTTCDYTYDGANGCAYHNNTINFGGFRGLRPANI